MSQRASNNWELNIIDGIGDKPEVRKGILAEQLYYNWASKIYDRVTNHHVEETNQKKGFDFSIWKKSWKYEYGVDVKGNMYSNGTFIVENDANGWLRNPIKKSDRIFHICPETGWAIEYDRKNMIEYLDSHNIIKKLPLLSSFDVNIKPWLRRYKVN